MIRRPLSRRRRRRACSSARSGSVIRETVPAWRTADRRCRRDSRPRGRPMHTRSRAASIRPSTEQPVSTPIAVSAWTRSSIGTLPLAPGANGQPPSPPTLASSRTAPCSIATSPLAIANPRVSCRCTPTGTSTASTTASTSAATSVGTPTPIVSARPIDDAPASAERRAASTTAAGAIGPSYGHPNDVDNVISITASSSPEANEANSVSASSVDAPALCRLWVSLTDTTYCRWSIPAASARSAPRRLSTSPQRTTSRCFVAALSASASAIAGTRSGRTKLVSSSSRTPAATSASAMAILASVLIGASSWSPSRRLTSRMSTDDGRPVMPPVSQQFGSCPRARRHRPRCECPGGQTLADIPVSVRSPAWSGPCTANARSTRASG